MEAQVTSGQFDASLFELANGNAFEAATSATEPVTETLKVQSNIVTLTTALTPSNVTINGMDRVTGTPSATGKFAVATEGTTTTVTFYNGDFADNATVEISYDVPLTGAKTLAVDNEKAAVGEAIFKWPVYNGGEVTSQQDGTFNSNSIRGWIILRIYRCRVTAMPGFDTSLAA